MDVSLETHIFLLETPYFHWRPYFFIGDPHIFIGDPIFSLETLIFSLETPRLYFWWFLSVFTHFSLYTQFRYIEVKLVAIKPEFDEES